MRGNFQRGRGQPRGNFYKRTFHSRGGQRGRPGRRFNHFKQRGGKFGQTDTKPWSDSEYQQEQRYDGNDDYYTERHEENTGNDYGNESYEDDYGYHGYVDEDYSRDDREFSQRTRHESDTLEYLERERYSRDEVDFQDREYERSYEKEYERDDREKWRYDEHDFHHPTDYYKSRYDERKYENEREQNVYDQYYRQDSYDERDYSQKEQYNRRESYKYEDREQVSSGDRNFNKEERVDDYSRGTGSSGSNYRRGNFQNDKKGKYFQKNWSAKSSSGTSSYNSGKKESISQSTRSKESPQIDYDWSTNESGIKMAIEFLKNKSVSSGNVQKEPSVEILNEEEARLPIINPESLGKEATDDLVSDLLNLVLKNGGEIPITKLEKEFIKSVRHRFKDGDVLKSFLKKYPKIFEFDVDTFFTTDEGETKEESEIVRAKTEVKLCQAHSNHPKSCLGECNSLHICKFYILSSCEMTKCKFGHNLSDDHNILVQQKFFLHRVELPNLCLLLQHDANRCGVTIPIICRYYQGIRGCRSDENIGNQQQQKCPFLHICQNFVEGHCKVWSSCRRNHNLLKMNVHEILCKYGLDPRVLLDGQKRVMALLRSSVATGEGVDNRKDFRNRYIPIQIKINEENSRLGLKRKVQVGGDDDISVKIQKVMDSSLSSGSPEKSMDQEKLESHKTLDKSVEDRKKMNESGGSTNENFDKNMNVSLAAGRSNEGNKTIPSWSISDNNKWTEISKAAMKDLEEKYQNYLKAKSSTVLIEGKYFEVDFTKLEGCYAGSSKPIKVQRKLVKKHENQKKTTEKPENQKNPSEND